MRSFARPFGKWLFAILGLLAISLPASAQDISLTPGVLESGDFGNRFNGTSDADGVITAGFESTGTDLTLSVVGFDIDFPDEVEVRVNGARLGFLSVGPTERRTERGR